MGTMSYAASLPGRKVDWRAMKEKGGLSPSLEPRCGVIAAPLRLGHIPSPPRALNSRTGAPRLATGLPHGSTQTIEGLARAANTTLIYITPTAGQHWNGRMRHVPALYAMSRQDGRRSRPDRGQRRDDRIAEEQVPQ